MDRLSEEVAREQVSYFLEYYDIDLTVLKEDQLAAVESATERLIRAIRGGKVEVLSNAVIRQTIKAASGESTELEYGELTGNAKLAMKNKSPNDYYGRIYALLGSLSGLGETAIAQLRGADLSIAECIGVLFLQV